MSPITIKALAVATCLSFAGAAEAATFFQTTLSGANENPPNATTGTGAALVTVDGTLMTIDIAFQDMSNPTTIAHIHCCAPPTANAGVATGVPTLPGFPAGVTSGSYLQTFDMTLASSYNPAFVTAQGGVAQAFAALVGGLGAGTAYLNIHTAAFPAGEIRGNFSAVPEPATWALMITGFALVGVAARSRRRLLPS